MKKLYRSLFFLSVALAGVLLNAFQAGASTSCQFYADNSPLVRTSGTGEENIVNILYSGLAQRYNGVSGSISGVRFWARVPMSVGIYNIARITMYAVNVSSGLPGTTLATTLDTIFPSNTPLQVDAVFPAPVTVSSDIIVSVEPYTPLTDNIWVQHNASLDGDDLRLNLVRQGTMWANNLDIGDPSWDYDFLIMPIQTASITSSFTNTHAGLTANLSNTSTNATTYQWDFGDANTSAQVSPSHTYASAGTYTVSLKAYSPDSVCFDSSAQQITLTPSGIHPNPVVASLTYRYDASTQTLFFDPAADMDLKVCNILGNEMLSVHLSRGVRKEVPVSHLPNGVYFMTTGRSAYKFYKN